MSKKKIRYAKLLDTTDVEKKPINDVKKEDITHIEPEKMPTPEPTPQVKKVEVSSSPPPKTTKPPVAKVETPVHPSVQKLLDNENEPTHVPPADGNGDVSTNKPIGQMICFQLEDEEYGIPISNVREIHPRIDFITLPNLPSFVAGIMNLRDRVIPVVDLGKRFGFREEALQGKGTLIISALENDELLGILVDKIQGVVEATPENVKDLPPMFDARESEYMPGVIKIETRLITLIDIDKLLGNEEIEELSGIGVD